MNSAVRALELTKADMAGLRNGMGADRALAMLAKLGAGMAEDVMITGGSTNAQNQLPPRSTPDRSSACPIWQ